MTQAQPSYWWQPRRTDGPSDQTDGIELTDPSPAQPMAQLLTQLARPSIVDSEGQLLTALTQWLTLVLLIVLWRTLLIIIEPIIDGYW